MSNSGQAAPVSSLGVSLLRNIGSALAGRMAVTFIGIVTFAVLARSLGAHGLGQYRTVLTLLLFAGVAFEFGLYSITLREMSQPDADQRRIIGNAVALRIAGTICALFILGVIVTIAGFDTTIVYGVVVAGAGWIGYQLNDLLRAVFQFKQAQHGGALAETLGAVVTMLLVIGLAYAQADTVEMLAATAAGLGCMAAAAWYFAYRLVPFRPLLELPVWRNLIIAGLPVAGSGILLTIQLRADVLFLSIMRSASDVGLYDAPLKLYELLFVIPYLFGGLMMPLFIRDRSGSAGTLAPRLNATVSVSFIISALMFAVLFVHAEHVVVLLAGSEFVDSGVPLRILAGAAAFAGVSAILRFAATALNQQSTMLRADVIGVCVAVFAHVILIPRFGAVGAALGKLCGDVATSMAAMAVLHRQFDRTILGAAGLAVTAGACLIGTLSFASDNGMHWLIASAVFGLLVAGGLFLVPRVRRDLASLAAS